MPALQELLKKYDVPGPRYTSYPTVPAWTTDVGPADYKKSLGLLKKGERLSLYFHLPFCDRRCHYCGCTRIVTEDHSRSAEYTKVLLHEMDIVASEIPSDARETVQVHFGGGTPGFFRPEEITEITNRARYHFKMLPDAEIAIEMHPRTSTNEFCANLKKLGFNRISIGVQDFDPAVQELISRDQTFEMTERVISHLRGLGFDSFNFDLIYGLPGQTIGGWKETLKKVLELKPNRLAVYSYAHVPWAQPFQRSFTGSDIPPPELKLELFGIAYDTFTKNGYQLIGMDHFALEDDELSRALVSPDCRRAGGGIHRNFMGYSTRGDAHQIGFGMSAISYVAGNYFQNAKDLDEYYQKMGCHLATYRGFLLQHDDKIRRDLIMTFMCRGRIEFSSFEEKWKIKFSDYFKEELSRLKAFVDDGILEIGKERFCVRGDGSLFLRNIAMTFDRYLKEIRDSASTPIFSRTV